MNHAVAALLNAESLPVQGSGLKTKLPPFGARLEVAPQGGADWKPEKRGQYRGQQHKVAPQERDLEIPGPCQAVNAYIACLLPQGSVDCSFVIVVVALTYRVAPV